MTIELKIPEFGESVREVQIGPWLKQEGDHVQEDENVVELETEKASMELPSPAAGVISEILKPEGETVSVGDVIAYLKEDAKPDDAGKDEKKGKEAKRKQPEDQATGKEEDRRQAEIGVSQAARKQAVPSDGGKRKRNRDSGDPTPERREPHATPSARRALREYGLRADEIQPAGKRLRREDVLRYVRQRDQARAEATEAEAQTEQADKEVGQQPASDSQLQEVVPMSLIRRRIAQRLVEAQQRAALVTTFNEIDMSAVMELRNKYKDAFQKHYGIKLGFMSFFTKAVIDALKQFPEVNAEIRDTDIVYRNYYHIGIAIGSDKGLVVPVLRNADSLSFAELEKAIDDFARRARERKLKPDELQGGTFTISNGGVYGSLLSTPVVNPPQSGVLGMHAIQERPVGRDGQIVLRPMMYVALTYDHRLIDGREAVLFLRRVREVIEDPSRMLIEV